MKKLTLALSALIALSASAIDIPKAIYVKKGDEFTKFNFGVADDLKFSDNGRKLSVTGYKEVIDLDAIDYISFSAPIDQTALTPAAQKEKLLQIGREAIGMVKPADQAELLNVIEVLFIGYHDGADYHGPLTNGSFPDDYIKVKSAAKKIATGLRMLAKGNPTGIRATRSGSIDLYKLDDYYGVFTFNPDKYVWEKTSDAGYLELQFKAKDGVDCSVRLEATNNSAVKWTTPDVEIEMPTEATTTIYRNGKALASSVIKTTMVQDKSIEMTVDFEANGYEVVNNFSVVNDKINDSVSVEINGKTLCTANSVVDGKDLLDYEQMKSDIDEASEKYDEATDDYIDGKPESLLKHFIRTNGHVDLLGKLQLDAKLFNFVKLYNELNPEPDDDDFWINNGYATYTQGFVISTNADKSIVDVAYNNPDICQNIYQAQANHLNDFSDAYFSYDKNGKRQGFLAWQFDDSSEDYEQWYDSDPDYQWGYIIRDNKLINVNRQKDWNTGDMTDWTFSMYKLDANGDIDYSQDPITVTVDPSEVIKPTIMRQHYYECIPVLVFNDMTSYKFEDFFDETSFQDLINDYDEIINSYRSVTGQD